MVSITQIGLLKSGALKQLKRTDNEEHRKNLESWVRTLEELRTASGVKSDKELGIEKIEKRKRIRHKRYLGEK